MGLFDNLDPVAGLDVEGNSGVFGDIKAPSEFGKGLKRGAHRFGADAARTAEALAGAVGATGLKQTFAESAEASSAAAQELAPRVPTPFDVEGVGSAIDYATGLLGEQAIQLPITALAAVLGGRIGARFSNPADRVLATMAGAAGGAAVPSYVQNFGDIYGEQREAGVDDPALAAKYAIPVAALDVIGPGLFAGLVTGAGKAIAEKNVKEFVKRILSGAGLGIVEEGPTEALQERLAVEARAQVDPNFDPNSDENIRRVASAGIGGSLVGSVVGGGGGAINAAVSPARAAPVQPAPAPATTTVPQTAVVDTPAPTAPAQEGQVLPGTAETALPEISTEFPLIDPTLGTPQVDPLAEREFAERLAQADAEFAASPERLTADALKSQVPEIEAKLNALDAELKQTGKNRRATAKIAADRVALTGQLAAVRNRIETLEVLAETPHYQPKSPLVQGTLLSVKQPEVITNAAEKRIIEESSFREREERDARGQAAEAGRGDRAQQGAQLRGESGSLFQEEIARIKKSKGELLSSDELRALRPSERAAAVAARSIVTAQDRVRTRTRPVDPKQAEALRASRADAVTANIQHLVENKLILPDVAPSIGVAISQAVDTAQRVEDPEAREAVMVAGVKRALHGKKIAAPDMDNIVSQFLASINSVGEPVVTQSEPAPSASAVATVASPSEFDLSVAQELNLTRTAILADREAKAASGTLTPRQDKAIQSRIADIDAGLAVPALDAAPLPFKLSEAKAKAGDVVRATSTNGGTSYNFTTGQEMGGTNNYAVSAFKAREVIVPGMPTEAQLKDYIEANEDLLRDPTNVLGTWYNPDDGNTYLDISKLTPSLTKAQVIARKAAQIAIFNLRTFETIPTSSPAPAQPELFRNVNQFMNLDRAYHGKAIEAINYLEHILGTPRNLTVRTFTAKPGSPSGRYARKDLKSVISLAKNLPDIATTAAHEGFHFLEHEVLNSDDKVTIRRAFARGSPLFKRLEAAAAKYDLAVGSTIVNEINSIQAEAHAYGYEFWKRGDLEVDGILARVFEFIRSLLERISNGLDGYGFRTAEDIFTMIDRGMYARREVQALYVEDMDGDSWVNDIEPDAIPGLQRAGKQTIESTASSQARGRPYWVKSGADVAKLRRRLKTLAVEAETARAWHRDSGEEMLKLYGGDKRQAEILAKLVAVFSPRTPVGTDLQFALKAIEQFRRNEPIRAGVFPTEMSRKAQQILTGTEDVALVTGIKRNTFYRNLMNAIDPVNFSTESQGATIDMWMAHAFGFNHNLAGKVNKSEYRYAEAEVGRLARELGWTIEETQAAIWTAVKARFNQTRSEARKWGISKGMFVAAKPDRQAGLFAEQGGKAMELKKDEKTQRRYLENWTAMALSVPLDQRNLDDAHYNYGMALRELQRDGRVAPHNIEAGDALTSELGMEESRVGIDDDMEQASLKFYRVGALADLITEAKRGEAQTTQMYSVLGAMIDRAEIPESMQKEVFGNTIKGYTRGVTGSLKTFYDENISSGMNLARKSVGYKNMFGVLTAYSQRKNRLIADAVDTKLSEWRADATNENMEVVSRALLDRTVNGYKIGSPEMNSILQKLSEKERRMFTQATGMIEDRLLAEFEADRASFARLLGPDTQEFADWLANRSTQVGQLITEGYFPERRYGDHIAHVYMDVGGKRLTLSYEQSEVRGEAERRVETLKSVLKDYPELQVEYAFRYKAEYDGSISFQQFLDVARRQGIELTQAEKERLAKALVSADSVRRNRIFRRKNVPGFSEDGMRILAEFAVTMSNKIAYSEFGASIQDALQGTVVEAKFAPNGDPEINTYAGTNAWAQDGELSGFYRNLADSTADFVLAPQPSNKVSSFLRGAATFQFLGGSLSAGAIQLTSLAMNTTPYLSAHTSYTDALGKTLGALKVAIANTGVLTDIAKLQDTTISVPEVDSVPGLRQALSRAAQDGTNLDTEIYQIMGLTRGKLLSKSKGMQRALKTWMLPFQKTEQWNRLSTFMAAYKVGLQNKLGGDTLYNFAQNAVYRTQFRYDEANRPALARGPVGAMLFTFKTYPIFMLETMNALARENPKAAVVMLLSLTAMAGIEGLPFAEDIEDLVDTVAQRVFGSRFNSKRALRNMFKDASEVVVGVDLSGWFMHGVANQMTGMNFASRVGLGNLLPGSNMGLADADYKKVMSEILGPTGAVAQSYLGGLDALTRGQFNEAAKTALPLGARNLLKGVEQFQSGFATDIGGRNIVPVNSWESFWHSLGFTSSALSSAYEIDRIDRATVAFYKQAQQQVTSDIIKAVKRGDSEAIGEAIGAIGAWNRAYPDMPLAINGPSLRRTIAAAGMPLNQRTLLLLPRALRGSSESMRELYGTER